MEQGQEPALRLVMEWRVALAVEREIKQGIPPVEPELAVRVMREEVVAGIMALQPMQRVLVVVPQRQDLGPDLQQERELVEMDWQ